MVAEEGSDGHRASHAVSVAPSELGGQALGFSKSERRRFNAARHGFPGVESVLLCREDAEYVLSVAGDTEALSIEARSSAPLRWVVRIEMKCESPAVGAPSRLGRMFWGRAGGAC